MAYMTPCSQMAQSTESDSKKLSPFEVYIALIKGYCVILVLILPKAFVVGGYMTSAILMFLSGIIAAVCANLLVQSGLRANITSYSELTGKVLGPRMKVIIDLCISLAQFSFTVSHISFIIESMRTTVNVQFGVDSASWPYFMTICIILTLIAWVEDIKKFSITFLVGNILIFITIITVSAYCIWLLNTEGLGPGLEASNPSSFWATVGFVIYSYEGIGIVMPILSKAREP